MGILDRPRTFLTDIEQNGIVFRFCNMYSSHDSALTEAYFQRKRGNYARIVKKKSKLTGETVYGVYCAKKQ